MALEITTLADDEIVAFDGHRRRVFEGVAPGGSVEIDGETIRTPSRRGELLATVCTTNDVHFGETTCGVIDGTDIGPTFSTAPGEDPYPEVMNRGAVVEMAAARPDAVVVKGDLTASGTTEEYQRFLDVYRPAFGDRLHHVRGNHDSYHGGDYAAWPTQEVTLDGVTLAILDTSRDQQVNGSLSAEQIEWLDELGARVDQPVLVFGHHNTWNPSSDPRSEDYFGIRPDDAEALHAVFGRRPRLAGYFAGHTHRNLRQAVAGAGDAPFVEVACVKDYPGAWAEYRVFEGVILQVFRRVSTPEALEWTEKTRHMYQGSYAGYAFGTVADRNFEIPIT